MSTVDLDMPAPRAPARRTLLRQAMISSLLAVMIVLIAIDIIKRRRRAAARLKT